MVIDAKIPQKADLPVAHPQRRPARRDNQENWWSCWIENPLWSCLKTLSVYDTWPRHYARYFNSVALSSFSNCYFLDSNLGGRIITTFTVFISISLSVMQRCEHSPTPSVSAACGSARKAVKLRAAAEKKSWKGLGRKTALQPSTVRVTNC